MCCREVSGHGANRSASHVRVLPHSGTYNKGSRIWRGGLSDGWGAHSGGNILKITGTRLKQKDGKTPYAWVRFPVSNSSHPRSHSPCFTPFCIPQTERQAVTDKVHLRGYIKIVKGKARACMTIGSCGSKWTKAITSKSKDGWHQINVNISGSHVSSINK